MDSENVLKAFKTNYDQFLRIYNSPNRSPKDNEILLSNFTKKHLLLPDFWSEKIK